MNALPQPTPDEDPPSAPHIEGPIDIRSLAITGIFLILGFAALRAAWSLFLPMFLAILANLALTPVVRLLERLGLPKGIGAALVLAGMVALLAYGVSALSDPARDWLARAPRMTRQLESRVRAIRNPIDQITEATEQVERLAAGGESPEPKVELKPPRTLAQVLFDQAQLVITMGATTVVLLYFLLSSGDIFLQKLVESLPRLSDKKRAVQIVRRVEGDVSRYLLTISVINSCLGAIVGTVLYLLGMPTPVLWGVMVAVLNYIPFLGAVCSGIILGAVALLSFDSLAHAALVPLLFGAITSFEGMLLTPALLGRRLALSPVAVFASLMLWTWLWGVPGALLAVPILAIVKIVFDHSTSLRPIGHFLGG